MRNIIDCETSGLDESKIVYVGKRLFRPNITFHPLKISLFRIKMQEIDITNINKQELEQAAMEAAINACKVAERARALSGGLSSYGGFVKDGTEATIDGHIARCEDGSLTIYGYAGRFYRRTGNEMNGYWQSDSGIMMHIDRTLFPDIRWEDEPKKVSITIKLV